MTSHTGSLTEIWQWVPTNRMYTNFAMQNILLIVQECAQFLEWSISTPLKNIAFFFFFLSKEKNIALFTKIQNILLITLT